MAEYESTTIICLKRILKCENVSSLQGTLSKKELGSTVLIK